MSESSSRIREAVEGLLRKYLKESQEDRRKESTAELAERLAKAGSGMGYTTWGNHLNGKSEYLVDYTWSNQDEDRLAWKDYTGLALAVEIEWDGTLEAVWQDFVKLADIRAEGRMFIACLTSTAWSQVRDEDARELSADFTSFWAAHRSVQPGDWVIVGLIAKSQSSSDEPEIHLLERLNAGASSRRLM